MHCISCTNITLVWVNKWNWNWERERERERERGGGLHEFFGSGSTSTYTFLIFNIKECHEHIRTDRWSTILKDISMFFRATSLLRSTSPSLRKLRFSCLSVSSFLQAPLRLVNYAAGLSVRLRKAWWMQNNM